MELRSIHVNDTADRQYVTLVEKEGVEKEGGEAEGAGGKGAKKDGGRTLTIVIGWNEVQAVDRFVKGASPPRPLTHELLASLLTASGAVLDRVDVTELKEGTFYAVLRLTRADGSTVDVDARPSDALALATALAKPIYVAEAVIDAARDE
jgi:bifunctional DNase/RNase